MGGCPVGSWWRGGVAADGVRMPIGGVSAARDGHHGWGGWMVSEPIIAPHAAMWPRRGGAVIGRPTDRSRRCERGANWKRARDTVLPNLMSDEIR